ncbi:hypothetical protein CYLTODRAFT_418086 [Cylindrobasidium torrendii FP15055 ss-10]|uniref:C2H2-type domain-containing protein n=1 Tax=Cylindrobasidium torrendii FP15055 ss-10 TaxID=1314674 RepID=A0A0D7BP32_9AGAR|nr:hypothetical protein CYLTODRAFT_418086 [Cylindrobasidium torrendii FP15055 ss-10]
MDTQKSTRRNHSGNNPTLPKTLSCPVCSNMFTRMNHLQRHLVTHSQNRSHQCEKCPARFTRRDLLTRHARTCGVPPAPRKRKPCDACAEAQRVCDNVDPQCTSCALQGRLCLYKGRKRSQTVTRKKSKVDVSAASNPPETTVVVVDTTPAPPVAPSVVDTEPFEAIPDFFDDLFACPSTELPAFEDPFLLTYDPVETPAPPAPAPAPVPALERPAPPLPSPSATTPSTDHRAEYQRLYDEKFALHYPLVHRTVRDDPDIPGVLFQAMEVCGTTFLEDAAQANQFVIETMSSMASVAPAQIVAAKDSIRVQALLLLAVALVVNFAHTSHTKEIRDMSRVMHSMMVMMARQTDLLKFVQTWALPYIVTDFEKTWREWGTYESAKKALFMVHDIDCTLSVLNGTLPLVQQHEIDVNFSCIREVWDAPTAHEWYTLICCPPSPTTPLLGAPYLQTVEILENTDVTDLSLAQIPPLSRRNMMSLILGILRNVFIELTTKALDEEQEITPAAFSDETLFGLYGTLQNWMYLWMNLHGPQSYSTDVSFSDDPMPFYWLAHVSLWVMQSDNAAAFSALTHKRLFVIERWFRRIRVFLHSQSNDTLTLWQDLVEIFEEVRDEESVQYDGLVAFFAKTSLEEQ